MLRRPHLLIVLTLMPLAISTVFVYASLSRAMHKEMMTREVQIRQAQRSHIIGELKVRIDTAWDIVNYLYQQNQTKEACKEILSRIDANSDGYVYVQALDTPTTGRVSLVVHPDKKLLGSDTTTLIDLDRITKIYHHGHIYPLGAPAVADVKPTDMTAEMRQACRDGGSGIIEYLWPRIVDGKASEIGYPKIAYVRYFKPWKWIIGTGAYADHIDKLVDNEIQVARGSARRVWKLLMISTLAVAIILGLISLGVSHVYSHQIKRYENSLLESRERLRREAGRSRRSERVIKTLINHLPQKVVLKDSGSIVTYCNEKYAGSLGFTAEEMIGKSDHECHPDEIADDCLASDREVLDQNKTIEMFSRRVVDGREVVTRVLKTPVKTDDSQVDGVLCLLEDFTQRVHNEERLKAANAQLEETNQRLQETQIQLVQNEKLASIGHLAAGIAHEINNPMCFVVGNCDLLQEYIGKLVRFVGLCSECIEPMAASEDRALADRAGRLQEMYDELRIDRASTDVQELIRDSHEGMSRVLKIVRNLRSFSRIDQIQEIAPYNLNEGIQSSLAIAANELNYKAYVETELGDIPDVPCDAGQINQVFLNILINAGQAFHVHEQSDMGHILIRTYREGDYVVCTIADDGPGIPPENLSKIFDPFFTTKPTGQGTGLGLNVSYDIIVNKHGGQLSVDSEPGKGATFTIKMPIEGQPVPEAQEESVHEPQDSAIC